jgi:glycosyltransferase involved in cell wall biosynthesis
VTGLWEKDILYINMKKLLYIFYIVQEWKSCNRSFLISELARYIPDADFVCVNRPADFVVAPLRHPYRLSEALHKEKRFHQLANNAYVMRPLFLLHDQFAGKYINQINGFLLRRQMEYAGVHLEQYERVIQWIYLPDFYHIARGVCKKSNIIFELFDEINLTPWDTMQKDSVGTEELVLNKSDLIFTLTDYIAQKRSGYKEKMTVIGNGVNYDLFSKAISFREKPQDMNDIHAPIIGLFGNIRNWIDFPLLRELVSARPDWSFVMVGSVEPDARAELDSMSAPNLHVLGGKRHEDLYKYLAFVDVGIIPYLQSEFIKASRPLKMFEYLAAGIPVVTVPVDHGHLKEIDGAVYIAKNTTEFIEKIERALNEGDRSTCQIIARKNSWNEVAIKILEACRLKWGIHYGI